MSVCERLVADYDKLARRAGTDPLQSVVSSKTLTCLQRYQS